MSVQISEAFVKQYTDNVTMQFQQGASKLRGTIRERSLTGKTDFWERVGPTAAIKKTTRHSDTPLVDTPHSRRAVQLVDYEWADLIDKQDNIRILIDPQSAYTRNAASAMGRAFDSEVIGAFSAAIMTGEEGTTSVAFANDWPTTRGAGQGDDDFSSAALTIANLLKIKKEMDDNDVPDEGRHILLPPCGVTQLLAASSAPFLASSDYNTVKSLVRGDVDSFLGFTFHKIATKYLPLATGTKYYGFAWHNDAMAVSMGMDVVTRINERADKSYSTQVYLSMSFGAGRIQGEGVTRLEVDTAL